MRTNGKSGLVNSASLSTFLIEPLYSYTSVNTSI